MIKRVFSGICTLLLIVVLLAISAPGTTYAEDAVFLRPFILTLRVGDNTFGLRAYHASYEHNIFLSLTDLSLALNGTEKQYSIVYSRSNQDGEYHDIRTGEPYLEDNNGITPTEYDQREDVWLVFKRNRLFVNGEDRKYYTCREGGYDLFMNLVDVQLMLDLNIQELSSGVFRIDPQDSFTPDYLALQAEGYFNSLNGFVVGDADTGVMLCGNNMYSTSPVASISKLMTYLLVREAMQRGEFEVTDTFSVSPSVAAVAQSGDGIVYMEEGQEISVQELLEAMLVASSNESSVALAEMTEGSEEFFVKKMNDKAAQLGLSSAKFYTSNGLPSYTNGTIPAKLQNCMSPYELFRLCSYVLKIYPEITEITSKEYVSLPSVKYASANSNPLVFNLPGTTGLKTGSTTRAGYCLAASLPVTVNRETHTIILVLLGAETASERGQMSEILLQFAKNYYEQNGF